MNTLTITAIVVGSIAGYATLGVVIQAMLEGYFDWDYADAWWMAYLWPLGAPLRWLFLLADFFVLEPLGNLNGRLHDRFDRARDDAKERERVRRVKADLKAKDASFPKAKVVK